MCYQIIIFNQIGLARRVVKENRKFDDLSEVAKLFNLYKSDAPEEPPSAPEEPPPAPEEPPATDKN